MHEATTADGITWALGLDNGAPCIVVNGVRWYLHGQALLSILVALNPQLGWFHNIVGKHPAVGELPPIAPADPAGKVHFRAQANVLEGVVEVVVGYYPHERRFLMSKFTAAFLMREIAKCLDELERDVGVV